MGRTYLPDEKQSFVVYTVISDRVDQNTRFVFTISYQTLVDITRCLSLIKSHGSVYFLSYFRLLDINVENGH